MRGGRKHPFNRTEFFRNESRHIPQITALDEHHQIVAAAGKITGNHLFETGNAHRQTIESTTAFRRDFYLNEGGNAQITRVFAIDHRVITTDRAVVFPYGNFRGDIIGICGKQLRKLLVRKAAVVPEKVEKWIG